VPREALEKALSGMSPVFAGVQSLKDPATLRQADLLVIPYGSGFPADDWASIIGYLRAGGNMLIIGGQALRVPVTSENGGFTAGPAQEAYFRPMASCTPTSSHRKTKRDSNGKVAIRS
jgi:hypothetical protein